MQVCGTLSRALPALLLAGCGGLGSLSTDYTGTLERGAAQPSRLAAERGTITDLVAPIHASDMPPRLQRTIESIHPGGETVLLAREWNARGEGYRAIKSYTIDGVKQVRSVFVDHDGVVLERTHEIPAREAPAAVLDQATRLARGSVMRVEVVQGVPGEELFRVLLQSTDGRRTLLQCAVDGSDVRWARIVPAELLVWD